MATQNWYTKNVYLVKTFTDHDGSPDCWANMHEETFEAIFETEEMAVEWIMAKVKICHLKVDEFKKDERHSFTIVGFDDDVSSEFEKMIWSEIIEHQIPEDFEYDSCGWSIDEIDMYSSAEAE